MWDFFFLTLQYCIGFCHILTWIHHGCTCIPHPEPPSHLPSHPIPLGLPNAPAPSTLSHALNLDWRFVSHMIIYMFQCHSSISSRPRPLLQSPKDSSSMWDLVSCSTPQSAIEPASPALVGRILNHWTTREVLTVMFKSWGSWQWSSSQGYLYPGCNPGSKMIYYLLPHDSESKVLFIQTFDWIF